MDMLYTPTIPHLLFRKREVLPVCARSWISKEIFTSKMSEYSGVLFNVTSLLYSILRRFDKIIRKEIPSTIVYEDDKVLPDVLCYPSILYLYFTLNFFWEGLKGILLGLDSLYLNLDDAFQYNI